MQRERESSVLGEIVKVLNEFRDDIFSNDRFGELNIITVKLPADLLGTLNAIGFVTGITRSEIIRVSLFKFLESQARKYLERLNEKCKKCMEDEKCVALYDKCLVVSILLNKDKECISKFSKVKYDDIPKKALSITLRGCNDND